ncbi:MAG: hypothetical protein RL461_1246 [Planctomycetota bacterium]
MRRLSTGSRSGRFVGDAAERARCHRIDLVALFRSRGGHRRRRGLGIGCGLLGWSGDRDLRLHRAGRGRLAARCGRRILGDGGRGRDRDRLRLGRITQGHDEGVDERRRGERGGHHEPELQAAFETVALDRAPPGRVGQRLDAAGVAFARGGEGAQCGAGLAEDVRHATAGLVVQVQLLLDEPEDLRLAVGALAELLQATRERGIAILRASSLVDERVDHAHLLARHLRQGGEGAIELPHEFTQTAVDVGLRGELGLELLHDLERLDRFRAVDLDGLLLRARGSAGCGLGITEEEAADRAAQRHGGPYCIASMRPAAGGILVLALASCGGHDPAAGACRGVASFSPAITATVLALGAGDTIVGRTPWCAVDAPVVGSLLDLDAEALVQAHPCALLIQPPAQGVDGAVTAAADRLGARIHAWPLATLADVRALVEELPAVIAPGDDQVHAQAQRMLGALDAACEPMAWNPSERVLIVQAGGGRMAFGPDTYLGEFLRRCGIPNAIADGAWRGLDQEEIVALAPAVIVLVGTGASPWSEDAGRRTGATMITVDDDTLLVPSGTLGASLVRMRAAFDQARSVP